MAITIVNNTFEMLVVVQNHIPPFSLLFSKENIETTHILRGVAKQSERGKARAHDQFVVEVNEAQFINFLDTQRNLSIQPVYQLFDRIRVVEGVWLELGQIVECANGAYDEWGLVRV